MIGRIEAAFKDYKDGGYIIQLRVKDADLDKLSELRDTEIDATIKKHRLKRSRDANSYFHLLCGELAKVCKTSTFYMKNLLIAKYGQPEVIDDEIATIKSNIPPEKLLEQESVHLWPIPKRDKKGVYWYRMNRPTHTYNSKEFSDLIDGTVEDAKEAGIETIPPAELERMMERLK